MSVVHEYPCGIHDLVYNRVKPGCPACALEKRLDALVADRDQLQAEVANLRAQIDKVRSVSDLGYSMKNAVELLGADDRVFLKVVLYQWRESKDIDLSVGEDGRSFLTNSEVHTCTSVGGIALAGLFETAAASYGRGVAMNMFLRAMSKHLTGGT